MNLKAQLGRQHVPFQLRLFFVSFAYHMYFYNHFLHFLVMDLIVCHHSDASACFRGWFSAEQI